MAFVSSFIPKLTTNSPSTSLTCSKPVTSMKYSPYTIVKPLPDGPRDAGKSAVQRIPSEGIKLPADPNLPGAGAMGPGMVDPRLAEASGAVWGWNDANKEVAEADMMDDEVASSAFKAFRASLKSERESLIKETFKMLDARYEMLKKESDNLTLWGQHDNVYKIVNQVANSNASVGALDSYVKSGYKVVVKQN